MHNSYLSVFSGLFESGTTTDISVGNFLLCVGVSLVIGALLAAVYAFRSKFTKSFLITLGILPAIVCVVIIMVNGNIGAGVAVAGAFALVRFRSVPGTAKEIAVLFLAMATGLMTGMGYLAYAALFAAIISVILLLCQLVRLPQRKKRSAERTLRITVPEDLDYAGLFDEVFAEYTSSYKILRVKTTNMGSLFKLTYAITEKDVSKEKQMIDALRIRNGNLEIAVSEPEEPVGEL